MGSCCLHVPDIRWVRGGEKEHVVQDEVVAIWGGFRTGRLQDWYDEAVKMSLSQAFVFSFQYNPISPSLRLEPRSNALRACEWSNS